MSESTWEKLLTRFECPVDEGAGYKNDRWTNRDLIPIPIDRRTYKIWSFVVYWFVSGACISAYTTGSSLLAYGLTAQQAMACVVIGGLISGLLSVACGWMGEVHHIGFTVSARSSWGLKGGYLPICLRVFTSIWWFGIQALWGGQAISVALGALIPQFHNMKNTIPLSSHITTQDLIGILIWYACFIPLVLVPPEKLQRPFLISSIAFGATLIGLLAWSVKTAGGVGPLFHTQNTAASTPYSMMLGITSILSAWGSGCLGQSDWTRYAKHRYAPTISQMVAAPFMITITALVGVIVTSASSQVLGTLIWSPISLLGAIQDYYGSSSGVRAAVFFAGVGCAMAQLAINTLLNCVSTGMDFAGLWPRMINIRRGAYILAICALASNPWQILSSAATFLNVISGIGIFNAPLIGIMLADYLIVRKRKLKIEDLYIGDETSIYWYWKGLHWRAAVAWVLGSFPSCPGFIISLINPTSTSPWVKIFNISFCIGFGIAFLVYLGICLVSPPPHLDQGLDYLDDERWGNPTASGYAGPVDVESEGSQQGHGGEKKDGGKTDVLQVVPSL